jgi:hypothetical protein
MASGTPRAIRELLGRGSLASAAADDVGHDDAIPDTGSETRATRCTNRCAEHAQLRQAVDQRFKKRGFAPAWKARYRSLRAFQWRQSHHETPTRRRRPQQLQTKVNSSTMYRRCLSSGWVKRARKPCNISAERRRRGAGELRGRSAQILRPHSRAAPHPRGH